MEITRDNAETLIPIVEARLRACSFFAIDLEFSGIDRGVPSVVIGELMKTLTTPIGEGYAKKRDILKQYTIMQIGISIFKLSDVAVPKTPFDELIRKTDTQDGLDTQLTFFNENEKDTEKTLSDCQALARAWVSHLRGESRATLDSAVQTIEQDAAACLAETRQEYNTLKEKFSSTGLAVLRKQEFFARWMCLTQLWSKYMRGSAWTSQLEQQHQRQQGSTEETPTNINSRYECQTYYAYLFPAPQPPFETIGLDSETVGTFLADHNMDFNGWIRNGLRFTTQADYLEARIAAVDELGKGDKTSRLVDFFGEDIDTLAPFSTAEEAYLNWIITITPPQDREKWHTELVKHARATIEFARSDAPHSTMDISVFVSNELNGGHLRVLKGMGLVKRNKRYERVDNWASSNKATTSTLASRTPGRVAISREHGGSALLFSILTATCSMRKPIVVHNGYTDLMMLLQLINGELPETFAEFKSTTKSLFPQLYDTRALCSVAAIQKLGNLKGPLERTYSFMKELNASGFQSDPSDGSRASTRSCSFAQWGSRAECESASDDDEMQELAAHNAGYDAFLTGCLFAMVSSAMETCGAMASTYRGVVAVYGSIFYISTRKKTSKDVYLVPDGNPVFFIDTPGGFQTIERVRKQVQRLHKGDVTVSVFYVGGHTYVVEISHMAKGVNIDEMMSQIGSELSCTNRQPVTVRPLDFAQVKETATPFE